MRNARTVMTRPAGAHRAVSVVCITLTLAVTGPAQDNEEPPKSAVSVLPAGVERYSRGGWTSVAVAGANPTDADTEEVVSLYLGEDPNLQFAKKFWLPAGGRRTTWLPIRVPPDHPPGKTQVDLSTMRLAVTADGEGFTNNFLGMPITKRSLMMTEDEINTAFIVDRPVAGLTTDAASQLQEELEDTIFAGRDAIIDTSLNLGIVSFNSSFFPPTPNVFDELDQIVIASNRMLQDTGGLDRLRSWLHGGGRVWIMLDRVDESVATALLGDRISHLEVDRVELNEFELRSEPTRVDPAIEETWTSEKPVEFVRVMADVDDVPITIDGWPAAFWQTAGQGEVLFTTLGPRGWLINDAPSRAYRSVASRFYEPRNRPVPPAPAMTPILDDQIGYEIPSRSVAATVLGLNAFLILLAGCVWARQRRLERLAFLIPVTAVASTAVLLIVGNRQVSAVPSTVATGQIVQVHGTVGEAQISTVRAIYNQSSDDLGLMNRYRSFTMPPTTDSAAGVQRVLWDDAGRSYWLGAAQPPGVVRYANSESMSEMSRPVRARGTFDAGGFRGNLLGLEGRSVEDALIIAAARPSTAVTASEGPNETASVSATTGDLLSPGQYIAGALISEQQRMRQDLLRELLASPDESPFGRPPSVLFWTDPIDIGTDFSDRMQRRGAALACVPIDLRKPDRGTEFQIPPTFIGVDTYPGERGFSSIFNPRTGQWLKMSKPTAVELAFEMPDSLAPIDLNAVTVSVKINAPGRSLIVKTKVDGEPTAMFQEDAPSGLVQVTIDDPQALQLDANGDLWVALEVTQSDFERNAPGRPTQGDSQTSVPDLADNSQWQIDYVHLSAFATSR